MNEQVLEAALAALLRGEVEDLTEGLTESLAGLAQNDEDEDEDGDSEVAFEGCSTFAEDGVMSMNRGLVLRLSDGSEFQVTLVRSR